MAENEKKREEELTAEDANEEVRAEEKPSAETVPAESEEELKPEETSEGKAEESETKAGEEQEPAKTETETKAGQEKPEKPAASEKEAKNKASGSGQEEETPEQKSEPKKTRRGKAKGSKNVPVGIANIRATFNNTLVSITDMTGAVISWSSAGRCGFKGSRKSTAFAATMVAQEAARAAQFHGLQEVEVRVQGPGAGRESAIRALQSAGLTITAIRDVTPIPHNGCRPPKRRRV